MSSCNHSLQTPPLTSEQQHIIGPSIHIGNTYTVMGAYRLLASLRRLATWMEQDYRPWLEATLSWAGYE